MDRWAETGPLKAMLKLFDFILSARASLRKGRSGDLLAFQNNHTDESKNYTEMNRDESRRGRPVRGSAGFQVYSRVMVLGVKGSGQTQFAPKSISLSSSVQSLPHLSLLRPSNAQRPQKYLLPHLAHLCLECPPFSSLI